MNQFIGTIWLLGIVLIKKSNILAQKQRYFMIAMLLISTIWQIILFWSYFLSGPRISHILLTIIGVVLIYLIVIFQTEILSMFLLQTKKKFKVKLFQYTYTGIFTITFVAMICRLCVFPNNSPDWLSKLFTFTYIPCVVIGLIYENFHTVVVVYILYSVSKSFAETTNLNPEIWRSQNRTYFQLCAFASVGLFWTWVSLFGWFMGIGGQSETTATFPYLLVIGVSGLGGHIVFVLLFYKNMQKVPLERHKGVHKGRTFLME
ncbi:hypothetical protein BC833DRAFT_602817 [Globomyces pollinis-pini]|nr:hypothetical protein BC833DRAFT_602817 [Globomyces pollinis-pini]